MEAKDFWKSWDKPKPFNEAVRSENLQVFGESPDVGDVVIVDGRRARVYDTGNINMAWFVEFEDGTTGRYYPKRIA